MPSLSRDLELEHIKQQLYNCAIYHPTFINKPELDFKDKTQLDKLSLLYKSYKKATGLDKIELNKSFFVRPNIDEWRNKAPLERYNIVNVERATILGNFTKYVIENGKLEIQGKSCLDVGSGSNYFFDRMNTLNRDKSWHGTDIPNERVAIAKDTQFDRNRNLLFKEYPAGGELPFKDIKFGLATMYHTLHHIDEQYLKNGDSRNVVSQVHERLEPGGYLLVLEDNIGVDKIESTKERFIKTQDEIFYPNSQGNQRSQKQWCELLISNGFKIESRGELGIRNAIGIEVSESVILARKPL